MTPAEEADNLRQTVTMLNDHSGPLEDWKGKNYGSAGAERLRRMVMALRKAEDYPGKMRLENGDLEKLEKFREAVGVWFEPDGTMQLNDFYPRHGRYDAAAMYFSRLLNNSKRQRLRGPCRNPKCGRWYVSKTNRQNQYCSRKCAASVAKSGERKREREKLLRKAQEAISGYETRPARFAGMGWKDYVVKVEPRITKKFLTVAASRQEIFPPKEGR